MLTVEFLISNHTHIISMRKKWIDEDAESYHNFKLLLIKVLKIFASYPGGIEIKESVNFQKPGTLYLNI